MVSTNPRPKTLKTLVTLVYLLVSSCNSAAKPLQSLSIRGVPKPKPCDLRALTRPYIGNLQRQT